MGGISAPIRLDVVCGDQIRIGKSNDGGMTWHVDFDVDLNASVHAIRLNVRELLRTIRQSLAVCAPR